MENLKIGIIDVDGHNFPNLVLMKISAYEKSKGNEVEFVNNFKTYNKVYMSKVFSNTPDYKTIINSDEIIIGGTGYNLKSKLSNEIELIYPDYDLYNIKNVAYGFLTRGCPRNCKFCIVAIKEGLKSYKVSNVENFWNGQKYIEILDPNILACEKHLSLLDQLIKTKAYINFNQGLDCRLLNKKNIEKILKCKIKMLHFAFDLMENETLIIKKLELFNSLSNLSNRKKRVYVLCNFNTSFEYDLYRVELLKKLNYDPYIMIFEKENCEKKYKRLQRYVNNKFIFWNKEVKTFNDYLNKSNNKKANESQITINNL